MKTDNHPLKFKPIWTYFHDIRHLPHEMAALEPHRRLIVKFFFGSMLLIASLMVTIILAAIFVILFCLTIVMAIVFGIFGTIYGIAESMQESWHMTFKPILCDAWTWMPDKKFTDDPRQPRDLLTPTLVPVPRDWTKLCDSKHVT